MEETDLACLNVYCRKIGIIVLLFTLFEYAGAQCLVPFPTGDIDSTLRNLPVLTNVTANDYTSFTSGVHEEGDSLSVYQVPAHGMARLVNDSSILYTPNPGYVGTDFYTYTLCNSCDSCAHAVVSIEVKAYCPAPLAVPDYDTVFNNRQVFVAVTANDLNIAGGPLNLTLLVRPLHGTATVAGDSIEYAGFTGYLGPDSMEYQIKDTCSGANPATAWVFLHVVTCLPVKAAPDTASVQQQSTIVLNVAANDTNVTGFGDVMVSLLSTPRFGSAVSVSGTTLIYTGGSLAFGKDSVKYLICTACGCDSSWAVINVTEKPCSAPVAVLDNVYSGFASNCLNIYNILANDTLPINGGTLRLSIVQAPLHGNALIHNNELYYTCTDSAIGATDYLTYSLCNNCFCDTGVVNITITAYPCNGQNPVVHNDTAYVCRNYPVSFNVLNSDYSPQGLTVAFSAVTAAPSHGSLITSASGNVTYTPAANFSGTDQFVFQVCDNGRPSLCNLGIATIYVEACNAPPVVLNQSGIPADTTFLYVREDSLLNYCMQVEQADSPYFYMAAFNNYSPDQVISSLHIDSNTTSGPCFTITPPNNSRQPGTVEVVFCNPYPLCDTEIMVIRIIPVDHKPIAKNDTLYYNWRACVEVNVVRGDTDIDPGDQLVLAAYPDSTNHGGRINLSGDSVLCYQPDSFFAGTDTFYYVVCDTSHLCDTGYVFVFVPVQARNDAGITTQDSTLAISVSGNDTRTAVEYLSICAPPVHGSVVLDNDTVLYTPEHDYPVNPIASDTSAFIGMDSFCYIICEVTGADTQCATAEVHIQILPKAHFYIPQGISPNGDGINDYFVVTSDNEFPFSQLLVYNRYGDEVWRSDANGYQNNFDGTWKKNGQPLPDGSYWYIFKFNDGVTKDRMGYIIIQR